METEGSRIVNPYLGDELHVLRGANVLAKVDLLEAVGARVPIVVAKLVATREVVVPVALATSNFPWEQARRERVDLVAAVAVTVRHRKGEHGFVLARGVVDKRKTVGDGLHNLRRLVSAGASLGRRLAKEAGVAARHVTGAHDVAEHHDVLLLGDDGLGVASVVAANEREGA